MVQKFISSVPPKPWTIRIVSLHHQVCWLSKEKWKHILPSDSILLARPSVYCLLTQSIFFACYRSLLKWYRTANIWWTTWRCREDIHFTICCNYVIAQLHFFSESFKVHLQIIDSTYLQLVVFITLIVILYLLILRS